MLRQHWFQRWGRHYFRRRAALSITLCALCFCVGYLSGCKPAWQSLYDDAHLKLQQGYYDAAIQKAGDGYRQSHDKDHVWAWRFRILQAEALMRNRQPKESVELLSENPPSNIPVEIAARKRIVQGQALCRFNRSSDGQAVLGEAEVLLGSGSTAMHAELAFARGYCAFDRPPVAKQYFEQAAELGRRTDPFIAASALGNIGYLASREGRRDEAIDSFQKVVPLAQAANSPLLEEKTLGNLGNSYTALGDYKRAIDNSDRAQRIAAEIGRPDDQESWLVDLGVCYASLTGDYPGKAEETYLKALSIASTLRDADIARRSLHNLAQLAIKDHDLVKAESYWKQELAQVSPGGPNDGDALLDEAEIALARKDPTKAKGLFLRMLKNAATPPIWRSIAQEQLGKIYWDERNLVEADRWFREGIRTAVDQLFRTKEEYRVSWLDQHAFFDPYVHFLIAQNRPAQALHMAEYGRALAQSPDVKSATIGLDIRMIQRGLKRRNQIILDYQVTDDDSYLWVITSKLFKVFQLPSHQQLHVLIDAYNNAIQEQRRIDEAYGGQELYKALVQPAEKLIPSGSQVIIVPSKILCLINFETLIVPGARPHYWIEDVVVQNLGSLVQAAGPKPLPRRNTKELLLIGAPEEVNTAFPPLKHAAEEISHVKGHYPDAREQVITGANATPQAYKASDPHKYRLIHFVTHGIANEKVPMESAIVLSGNAGSYKLYARDIVTTPLDADLVTISACYGAGKRWYVSEGIVGLGWAFMQAGARQVVAALWEVDDASTPQLMDDFYSEMNKRKSVADALRSAKLAMLRSDSVHSRPYYWASLQLYTRP